MPYTVSLRHWTMTVDSVRLMIKYHELGILFARKLYANSFKYESHVQFIVFTTP